jgi:hypothetical protein
VRLVIPLLCVLWALGLGIGTVRLLDYAARPCQPALPQAHWPQNSGIVLDADYFTLVLFAHPRCPCTRASISELAHLMTKCQGRVAAHVLFLKPQNLPADWEHTDLWVSAAAIPGVQVATDVDGIEARRFGVSTSGQVVVYSRAGRQLFSGGITGSRGHEGTNAGRSAVEAILGGGPPESMEFPVFGCALFKHSLCDREDIPCQKPNRP